MAAATAQEVAAMGAATDETRRMYVKAALVAAAIRASEKGPLGGLLVTDAQRAVAANIEALGGQVLTWSTTRRRDAEAGRRADGSEYTVTRYLADGREYAAAAAYHSGEAWDASLFAPLVNTVVQTTTDVVGGVRSTVDVVGWPVWLKVTAGAVVVLVVLVVVAPELRRLPVGVT
ncbi:hypothetical protein DRW03_06370 [Corallococcus sp. H22C18031201]|nr:hypothetical protein DRW03_06370 [Corallococcus sp. H22C18031201]